METNLINTATVKTTEQDCYLYPEENHQVWQQIMFMKNELFSQYSEHIDAAYLSGFKKLNLNDKQIPTIKHLNDALRPVKWSVVCINGYISASLYARLISQRIFPIARQIRSLKHIDHSPIPDFIHDVIGHLPMLFTPTYQEFLCQLVDCINRAKENEFDTALFEADIELVNIKLNPNVDATEVKRVEDKLALIHSELKKNPSELTHLTRMFLWSIEFGLYGTQADYKCFGAGILSSQQETLDFCHHRREVVPYSIDVINYDINFTDIQNQFFILESFDHAIDVLNQYMKSRGK